MAENSARTRATSPAPQQLLRIAGVMAMIGGALRILAAFIPYVPQSPFLESLYAAIDVCFLFGLAAIYWPVSNRLGWLGAAGYFVATTGAASIVGPDARMFGLEFYMVGSAVFELGLLVLAVLFIRYNVFRPAAALWIVSLAAAVLAVATGGDTLAFVVAGTALGLGFIWAGRDATTQARKFNPATVADMAFNQVTIGCNELAESIEFYRRLGFSLIVNSPENGYARFEAPNDITLSLHKGLPVPAGSVLYFEHPALDIWVGQLGDEGVQFDQPPVDQRWGWREARLRDPAGNPLCLFSAGVNRRFPPWRVAARLDAMA